MGSTAALEAARGERFEFGKNWERFLKVLTPERIAQGEASLRSMLDMGDLTGKSFLDIGSGSGLFSLAARRMGAEVHSFDYDQHSVGCTQTLRQQYFPGDPNWRVESGSVLDRDYLQSLQKFDIVYSWGVLHHTGDLWQAIDNASGMVKPGGTLFIALYNDQGGASQRWKAIKKLYVSSPSFARPVLSGCCFAGIYWKRVVKGSLHGDPLGTFRNDYRGMSAWRDVVDWVGGYPFEVSQPGEVFEFLRERNFSLTRMNTTHGSGCNEFVFRNKS